MELHLTLKKILSKAPYKSSAELIHRPLLSFPRFLVFKNTPFLSQRLGFGLNRGVGRRGVLTGALAGQPTLWPASSLGAPALPVRAAPPFFFLASTSSPIILRYCSRSLSDTKWALPLSRNKGTQVKIVNMCNRIINSNWILTV